MAVLTGERIPDSAFDRVLRAVVYSAFMAPWLLMGAGSALVGALALGPRTDIPELWVCLPAGLALLSVFGTLLWWCVWRVPALTVMRFALDGTELVVTTPARGAVACPVGAVRGVTEERGRRGRKLCGWWVRFAGVGSVYLTVDTPQAEALVLRLSAHLGHKHAEQYAGADGGRDSGSS
jgi:hypothetical protein